MTTSSRDEEQLADLRFKYELLINELFHLKEFTSLVEFDPSFRNSSESFNSFVMKSGLALTSTDGESISESNATRRIRKRSVRSERSSYEERIKSLDPLVDEKYKELQYRLDGEPYMHQKVHKVTSTVKKRKLSTNSSQKVVKVEEKKSTTPEFLLNKSVIKHSVGDSISDNKKQNYNNDYDDDNNYNDNDSFYFTTSSEEDEIESKRYRPKRPRITLTVNPPKQTVTNPLHVLKPGHPSLHDFLNSFKSLDDDLTIEEYNKYIDEQKGVFAGIRKGLQNGVLEYDPSTDSIKAITLKDATGTQSNKPESITFLYKEQQLYTLQDHLINQGIVMSKMFQDNRKARIARARKVSQMIEQHFRHVAGAEERKQKEEERRMKNLARLAMQAVKKRWQLAEKAFRVLKKDEEDQLKKIQGKEHLSKMLEQSTQLLGAQLKRMATNSDDDNESIMSATSENENSGSDSESITSTSSSESETGFSTEEEDTRLSVEQLQAKYANLDSSNGDDDEDYKTSSAAQDFLADTVSDSNVELSQREKLELEKNLNDSTGTVLDEDGESSLMDDSSEFSEEESEDDKASPEISQSSGLATLLTNIDDDDDDDEDISDYSSSERSDDNSHDSDVTSIDGESKEEGDSEIKVTANDHLANEAETDGKLVDDPLSVVDVPIPSLLRGTLRVYQKQGLNWLASLYNNNTNGILADEMGLGKTIQTISLLAYLACEKHNWGPHLIIVPTSVLLNWEMEFKRFAPGFKVLTYYGSPQQRKEKRKGWNKPNAFHVCITSYQLVVHDQHSFKRKKWQYMILDEAHNIKNFRSTRWQALLNFNTERRLLLTGTPLQNNLAELWSLLYFLMPQTSVGNNGGIQGFADLDAFQQWFGRPVDKIIETGQAYEQDDETRKTVAKLHQVLRPYLLRRLKADVEKQMPAKHEHIIYCRLSKRQRFLYDDFMSRAQTKETLASGNFMSIINCLMQLRKVCNHPDLFEVRPITTSFAIPRSVLHDYTETNALILGKLHADDHDRLVDLNALGLNFTSNDLTMTKDFSLSVAKSQCIAEFTHEIARLRQEADAKLASDAAASPVNLQNISKFYQSFLGRKYKGMIDKLEFLKYINAFRCSKRPVYGKNLVDLLKVSDKINHELGFDEEAIKPLETRVKTYNNVIEKFAVLTPPVVTLDNRDLSVGLNPESVLHPATKNLLRYEMIHLDNSFHHLQTKLAIAFPDKSLLQYDCGKLQKLAQLLRNLKDGGHRALIFTQMTKVLDILELFLNYHGYLYMRLDGATKIEDRQILTERFNSDPRITVFILSSRSGGLGINLTGADTVIFYDSDWNPAMDKQCQDRCHRIGQTRDVHIYRLVSENTIESNILKKANQKRELDNVVIQRGDFTTDYFTKLSVKDLLGAEVPNVAANDKPLLFDSDAATKDPRKLEKLLAQAEDEDDVKAANLAMREVEVDNEDFHENNDGPDQVDQQNPPDDEYEGTRHVEEYMIRCIANGFYND